MWHETRKIVVSFNSFLFKVNNVNVFFFSENSSFSFKFVNFQFLWIFIIHMAALFFFHFLTVIKLLLF